MKGKASLYADLVGDYLRLRSKNQRERLREYEKVLRGVQHYRRQYAEARRSVSPEFDPFPLLKCQSDEATHSDVLAWLFSPIETHAQGNLFFRHFAQLYDVPLQADDSDYRVSREYAGDESRIDILVSSPTFLFYIENKTLAEEGDTQTHREYRDMRRFARRQHLYRSFHAVFLTPDGRKPDSHRWKSLSYPALAEVLKPCLEKVQSPTVKWFVGAWLSTLRELGKDQR